MRSIYLIANWKMNPAGRKEALALWGGMKKKLPQSGRATVVLCPPFSYLGLVKPSKRVALGAQDCGWAKTGAFTGAVSPTMLKDAGCEYVIVGHSERREYFGETNEMINKKMKAALAAGLRPVLAVGEKARQTFDRRGIHTNELDPIVEKQLMEGLAGISAKKLEQILIAYEPVWAIGTGLTPQPDEVFSAVLFIRKILTRMANRAASARIPVLYGGSTDSKNLEGFLRGGNADGALVGGASLDAKEFGEMVLIAEEC